MIAEATAGTSSPTWMPLRALGHALDITLLTAHVPVVRRRLRAGQHLYRAGQAFHALFLVHAGFLRTSLVTDDGREQVTAFPMRGDLVGIESIGASQYVGDAVALDSCEILEFSYAALQDACAAVPELQRMLSDALAAELRRDRRWMLALGTLTAEQRVAAFLLELSARHAQLGFSASHFVLRMSRIDIGNFLAIKHETVTRALSHLVAQGTISVDRRDVRVACLRRLAHTAGRSEAMTRAA